MNYEMLQTFGEAHFLPVVQEEQNEVTLQQNQEISSEMFVSHNSDDMNTNNLPLPHVETINSNYVNGIPFTIAVINPGIMPEFNATNNQVTPISIDFNSNFVNESESINEILPTNSDGLLKAIQPQEMHLSLEDTSNNVQELHNLSRVLQPEGSCETMSSEKENDEDLLNLPTSDLITDEFWPSELNEYLIQKTQCFDLEEYLTFNDSDTNTGVMSNGGNKKKRRPKRRLKPLKPPKPPKVKIPRPTVSVKITKSDAGQSVYCCPQCNLGYTDKHMLERHLISHKADRRFICEVCGVAMKRKEHIQRHKLGHKDERPYSCSICSKGFKRKEHLDVHFVIHSGDLGKTFHCNQCSKRFYRRDHLITHQKSHVRKQIKRQLKQAQNALKPNTSKRRRKKSQGEEQVIKIEQTSTDSNTFTIPVTIHVNPNFDMTNELINSVMNNLSNNNDNNENSTNSAIINHDNANLINCSENVILNNNIEQL
uniref:CSON010101 protein n=1 Tax=Culicoides sonorensis TaxID=179676 RepID=A0A336K099_CULSO